MNATLRRAFSPLLIAVVCAAFLLAAAPVLADDYPISTCSATTLSSRVSSAATSSAHDTITLSAGCTYILTQSFDNLDNAENGLRRLLSGKGTLTINGNGARIERSSTAGTEDFRFFEVLTGGSLVLNNLTLANGRAGNGGAIFNDGGTVVLRNVTIVDSAAESGGAIANAAPSSVGGYLTLINSTLSGNSAAESGGALYSDATVRMINTSISGNQAHEDGGGIYNTGTLTVIQSTLTANSAGRNGGGLYTNNTTSLHNSIIADSADGGDCYSSGSPTIHLLGVNLVEDGGCGLNGASLLNTDPLLGPLADNGGGIRTHALLPHSPAIDAGSALPTDSYDVDADSNTSETLPTDQRELARVAGSTVDLGAFELQADEGTPEPPHVTSVDSPTADDTYTTSDTIDITITFSQAVDVTGTPQLTLETGDNDAVASYTGGSGTTILTFAYTVAAGESSADLDYAGTSALTLNGGSIQTTGGQAALLSLPTPGAAGSLGANKALVISTASEPPEGPTVTLEQAAGQTDPANSSPIRFTVVFSAPVSGFSSAGVDLSGSTTPGALTANVSPAAPADGTTYSLAVSGMSGDGDVIAAVRAAAALDTSNQPNSASSSADNAVHYDVTPPDTSLTSPAAGTITHSSQPVFAFSSADTSATFECRILPAEFVACTSGYAPDALDDGDYTFEVRAVDSARNPDPTPATITLTVDTAPPETTLTVTPPALTRNASPSFSFTSDEDDPTFECRLDDAAFATCQSGVTLSNLSDDEHTFEVRAVDAAGNTESTPASWTFTVDTAPPETTLTGAPNAVSNGTTASFSFTSEPDASFECDFDGLGYTACSSPASYDALDDGDYTFNVRAIDAAGNTESTPETAGFRIDTEAPTVSVSSTANDPTNVSPVPLTIIFSELVTGFEAADISVGNGARGALSSSDNQTYTIAITPSIDGEVLINIAAGVAQDAAGNLSAALSPSFSIDYDRTPPNTTITAPDDGSLLNVKRPGFSFNASESGATFRCQLDLNEAACTSPFTPASDLTDGPHSFSVRATDAAGNQDQTPAAINLTIDTIAPETTLEGTPPSLIATKTLTVAFSSPEANVTFQCRVDSGEFVGCQTSYTTAQLVDGQHTVAVRAVDAAGNADASPAEHSFTVDTTTPDTSISAPANGVTTKDTTPDFTFSSADPNASFECQLDGGDFDGCNSPYTPAALDEGPHTFAVRATDLAGNVDSTPATVSITVDLTAPVTTISAPAAGSTTRDTTPDFAFSSAESGVKFECQIDGGGFAICTSPHTPAALGDGPHTFTVRASDAARNFELTPSSVTFTIDTTAPNTTITSAPAATIRSNEAQFAFNSDDASASFECRLTGDNFVACTTPYSSGPLPDGPYTFRVRAVDAAGNTDATPAEVGFTVDTGASETTITAPADNTVTNDATPDFTFESDNEQATFECAMDEGSFAACTSPFTPPADLDDGEHVFAVRSVDAVGNADLTPATIRITIDATAPESTITSPADNAVLNTTTPTFSFSSESGATFECAVDAGDFAACTSPYTADTLAIGPHSFAVQARDAAGNTETPPKSLAFSIDLTAPDTTVPTVASVTLANPDSSGDPLTFTVTFSEPVSGVDLNDFALRMSGIDGSIGGLNGSGAAYTVAVDWSGLGTLALAVSDDDSIVDDANNPLGGADAGNGDYDSGDVFDNRPDAGEPDPQPTATATVNPPPAPLPPPPPAPLLSDFDGSTNNGVRARVPEGAYGVYGRVLAMDNRFVGDPAQIGSAELLAQPILAAVDVFSPNGSSAAGVEVCLKGNGNLWFLDAATSPRTLLLLGGVSQNDMTCALLPATGTVVLVAS